jgi:MFS family permease
MKRIERWLVLALLNSVSIQASTYLARPMITYKLLEMHENHFIVGSFGALYALFPLILAIPLGRWINHFGEGRFIALGTGVIVFSTLALSITKNLALMVVLVAVLGTSQLLCMAGAQALFANRTPRPRYESYFGYYTFSAALGQLVGPLIGAVVSGSSGVLPRSTSHAFLASAIIACLGLIPLSVGMPMKPTFDLSAKNSRESASLKRLLTNPGMLVAMYASLAVSSTVDVLVVFLPVFGKDRGFSSGSIGIILAIRAASSMLSRVNLGKLTEHVGYFRLLVGSIVISSFACLFAIFSKSPLFLGVVILIAGFSLGVGQPMTMAWVSRISRDDERSFAISIRLAGNRLGQFILPAAAGLISGFFGVGAVFIALALLMSSSTPTILREASGSAKP